MSVTTESIALVRAALMMQGTNKVTDIFYGTTHVKLTLGNTDYLISNELVHGRATGQRIGIRQGYLVIKGHMVHIVDKFDNEYLARDVNRNLAWRK